MCAARAIVKRPEVLLRDKSTGAPDCLTGKLVPEVIARIRFSYKLARLAGTNKSRFMPDLSVAVNSHLEKTGATGRNRTCA